MSIEKVLDFYKIIPVNIEQISDSLYKVDDGRNVYALKKSSLSNSTLQKWENVFHQAKIKNITEILPICITAEGSFYKEYQQQIYYIMPWVKNREQSVKKLYRTLGSIHAKTNKAIAIDIEKMKAHFHVYKENCAVTEKMLLRFVELFESNRYMSPLELQVCTHYHELELVLKIAKNRIDQLMNELNEQSTWNYCLCHGDLKLDHLLEDANEAYLINWESTFYGIAAQDLALFFKNEIINYDVDIHTFIHSFVNYIEMNELNKSELFFLIIHQLSTTHYLSIIENYINKDPQVSMSNQVIQLQRAYRQLIFGLELSNYITKKFETISLEDLEN